MDNRKLSKKGRYGDTHIRDVYGFKSHVNKNEAELIDSYGVLGETLVKDIGSGTINPETGLPEYYSFQDLKDTLERITTIPKSIRDRKLVDIEWTTPGTIPLADSPEKIAEDEEKSKGGPAAEGGYNVGIDWTKSGEYLDYDADAPVSLDMVGNTATRGGGNYNIRMTSDIWENMSLNAKIDYIAMTSYGGVIPPKFESISDFETFIGEQITKFSPEKPEVDPTQVGFLEEQYGGGDTAYEDSLAGQQAGLDLTGAGLIYDKAGLTYDAAGITYDKAGLQYDAAGRIYEGAGLTYGAAGRTYDTAGITKKAAIEAGRLRKKSTERAKETMLTGLQDMAIEVGAPPSGPGGKRAKVRGKQKMRKGFEAGMETYTDALSDIEGTLSRAEDVYDIAGEAYGAAGEAYGLAGETYGATGEYVTLPGPDNILGTLDDIVTDVKGSYGLAGETYDLAGETYGLAGETYGLAGEYVTKPGPDGIMGTSDDIVTDQKGTYGLSQDLTDLQYNKGMYNLEFGPGGTENQWATEWSSWLQGLPTGG